MEKDIQLCGIGNGLVDLQYEVDFEILEQLNAKHGQMTLVEADWQEETLAKLSDRKHNRCSGGSAANTIIAFNKFGGKAAYITSLGGDEFGRFYGYEFTAMGIELKTKYTHEAPTGVCLVLITPDSERTMLTSLGASALFSADNIDNELIARSEWLYVEGYKFSQPKSATAVLLAVEEAKKNNTKIAVTFSDKFIIDFFYDDLYKAVENSDLVFCNEIEAMAFTKQDTVERAFEELCKIVPNAVVTLGANGALIRCDGETYNIPAYKTEPLDTTGAGDMFAGAFLYGYISGAGITKAGHLASYAASRVISQFGARLKESHIELRNQIFSEV